MAITVLSGLKQNVSAMLGSEPLDVTTCEYELYRGGQPRPQIIPIGSARVADFTALGHGPHVLKVKAPSAAGFNVGTVETSVEGVYLDYVEATTTTEGFLRLYDVRGELQRYIVARDFNVQRPDDSDKQEATDKVNKLYKDDTAATDRTPATLGFALDKLRADAEKLGVKFDYEYKAPQVNEDLPDDLFLAGYYRFNEAIAYLCDLLGCDIAVTTTGKIRVIDRSRTAVGSTGYNWHIEPTFTKKRGHNLAAPATINVFVNQRYELEIVVPGATTAIPQAPNNLPTLAAQQVFNVGGRFLTAQDLGIYFLTTLRNDPSTSGSQRAAFNAFYTFADPTTSIEANIGNDRWEGSLFQTVPQEGGDQLAEALAAMAAKSLVEIIKRDFRKLYRIYDLNGLRHTYVGSDGQTRQVSEVLDSWNEFQFGVTDQYGQVSDFVDTGNNSRRSAVTGDWCELYGFPIHLQANRDAAIDGEMGANRPEPQGAQQPAPFALTWEDERALIVRLVPLSPLEASPLHGLVSNRWLGQWESVPRVRPVTTADLLVTDLGADVRTVFTPGQAALSSSINARLTMVATQRSPNDRSRFKIVEYKTGIDGAAGSIDVPASPDVHIVYDRNGVALNEARVVDDATAQAQRLAAAYTTGITGIGVAHGVSLLRDLGGPIDGVQSLKIMFGNGAWPYFIGTMVTYGAPSEGELARLERQRRLAEDKKGRSR